MGRRGARLDVALVERGLVETRSKARALILAGRVFRGEERLDKAGQQVEPDAPLRVVGGRRWVGRGGGKLDPVLGELAIDVAGIDALDVGASTGGFTQALLAHGARRVIALDVGRGQLDWSLRTDERVHVLEGINARHLRAEALPFEPQLAVVDVSFISLALVLAPVAATLGGRREIVALVKPQFEVGRGRVGAGGIVRDPADHRDVLRSVCAAAIAAGLAVLGVAPSPLPGAEGNREFFAHLRVGPGGLGAADLDLRIAEATAGPAKDSPP